VTTTPFGEQAVSRPNALLDSLVFIDQIDVEAGPDSEAPAPKHTLQRVDYTTYWRVGEYTDHSNSFDNRNQFREDFPSTSRMHGSHDLKLGLDYQLESSSRHQSWMDPNYSLRNGIHSRTLVCKLTLATLPTYVHTRAFSRLCSDDLSPKAGLSLNLGVRADYQPLEFNGLTGLDRFYSDRLRA